MVGNAALYQVAIALIPALLFGGATLQLREEGPGLGSVGPIVGVFIAIVLAAGVLAEIVAIRGVIDPSISTGEQRFLVLVLTLGTAGVAYWFAAPLLVDANGNDHVPYGRHILAALLIAAAALGQLAITDSLHRSDARSEFEDASKRRIEAMQELRVAEGDDARARAHLITLARSMRSPDLVARVVVARIGHLERTALDIARDEDIDADNVEKIMARAFAILNNVDDRLEDSFEEGIRGLDKAERELLLLAKRQLIAAVSLEMTANVSATLAEQNFERACEEADFLCPAFTVSSHGFGDQHG